jgi:hypothetical protein
MEGSLIKRIKVLLVGLGSYIVFIMPFITNRAFIESAATSGLTQRMFIPGISFGFSENFFIIPGLYLALIYLAINFDLGKVKNLYKYIFASMFLISSAMHFHAQWALWYLPFLLILLIRKARVSLPIFSISSLVLLFSYFGTVFLLNDRFLTFGLLSVFDPAVLYLPSPYEIVGKFYDPYILQSVFHTFYVVSGMVIAFKVLYEKNKK